MTILDVSYHQGEIDFAALKAADHVAWPGGTIKGPIDGVVIKLTGEEIGRLFKDSMGRRNMLAARAAGLRVGGYHFQNGAVNTASGADEAKYFLDVLADAGGVNDNDMLPTLDVEWPVDGAKFHAVQMEDYIETMQEQAHVSPLLYAGRWHIEKIPGRDLGEFTRQCPLWLAAYTASCPLPPQPWRSVALWQFSNKGRVAGISGDVDLNQRIASWGAITS